MGIRIQKSMGYGVQGLHNVYDENTGLYTVADPVLNLDYLNSDAQNRTDEEFLHWLDKKVLPDKGRTVLGREIQEHELRSVPNLLKQVNRRLHGDEYTPGKSIVAQTVIHDPETTGTGVLLAQPFFMVTDWNRWDDAMDYVEYSIEKSTMDTIVRPVSTPLFPYDGWMRDIGIRVNGDDANDFNNFRNMMLKAQAEGKEDVAKDLEQILERLVEKSIDWTDSIDDYLARVYPTIPLEVELVVAWLNVFNDVTDIHRLLRPMVVTYWS